MDNTLSLCAITALLAAGCGGNVVVDNPSGTGGAGGGTGSSSSSSSTTIEWTSYCLGLCQDIAQSGCIGQGEVGECQKSCVDTFQQYAGCQSEIGALFDCIVGQYAVSGCELPGNVCTAESIAATDCMSQSNGCGVSSCGSNGDQSCFCEANCGLSVAEVQCEAGSNGVVACDCILDGSVITSCEDVNLACSVSTGCCAPYFK